MNPPTMQPPHPPHGQPQFHHHQMPPAMQTARVQQQSNLMLAVALAGLGTYAFYSTLGDLQTVIYTVGGAYVLRILLQNPEIMRQLQARFAALQSGRPLPPMNLQGINNAHVYSNGPALPHIDTSNLHSGNGYQPLQATNGGSGLYDDFENSMATPTTPDPSYTSLPGSGPAVNHMHSRPDSRASTVQQRGPSPTITVATATPTVRNAPSIGMSTRPGTEFFDPRASTTSTFSAFAVPMTNPFASYQHYDNGTVNGERLLSPISENDAPDKFPDRGPLDMRASLTPGSGWDPRASIVSTFSAFAVPTINPFSSYTFYDAGTIGGERVAGETLSERIAAPPQRSDTSATVTQASETPASPVKTVSQSPYDAGAVIGQQLARRASRCYTGVTGVGLAGAGTGAVAAPSQSPKTPKSATPTSPISMSDYVPKRKHRQPTVAARVGEVAAPGGGIAPAPGTPTAAKASSQQERSMSPIIQPPKAPARPPTPGSKRPSSRPGTASPKSPPVPLPTTTRVELPARRSTVSVTSRASSTSPLGRSTNASPLRRSLSGSRTPGHSPSTSGTVPPVPRLMSPSPEPPVRFFEAPLMTSPLGPTSIHPMSPQFVASATAALKHASRSASGYDSDSSHASSSTSSRRSQEHQNIHGYDSPSSHARSDSLGLPSYEKHATTIFTLVPKRPGYVPQIQAILKTARSAWLALPGTVSHEVGQDDATGSVVVVETYESSETMDDFDKSKERDSILSRLSAFIDDSKTSVVRMPGSSAATRLR